MERGHLSPLATRLLLFLLFPLTLLLAPTLTAQGEPGEPPFPAPEPPELAMLELAAAPLTFTEFPAPATPLTVTIANYGPGPATEVTLTAT